MVALAGSTSDGEGWYLAASLRHLWQQVNEAYPLRNRKSDGSIGDADHQTRDSDHNPWVWDSVNGKWVVTAIDITDDDASGADMFKTFDAIRLSKDPRVKYGIHFNEELGLKRMFSSYAAHGYAPYTWRPYFGPNPHQTHGHMSVQPEHRLFSSTVDWKIGKVIQMVTRADKADEGLKTLETSFQGARSLGYASEYTQPGGITFNDEFFAVLDRMGLYTLRREFNELKSTVASLEKQLADGGGGVAKGTKFTAEVV